MRVITEYRVRGRSGLSGRGSRILNMVNYPHTIEQAREALEAERDYIEHDGLIRDAAFRAARKAEITLESRTVSDWRQIVPAPELSPSERARVEAFGIHEGDH